jgi:uracil-DNA glycosylase family 4
MKQAPVNTDILFVLEAPNWNDTFTPSKCYLTVDPYTDPSGAFFWDLFTNELGLDPDRHLFLTNSVLCLPRSKNGKFPVTSKQMAHCSRWLKQMIDNFQPKIVCTIGGTALLAATRIDQHRRRRLLDGVGEPIKWYGRVLYPLYHTARLARKPPNGRSDDLQRADWRKLRQLYNMC